MRTRYLYNENVYLLTNHSVAMNPIFYNSYYRSRFIEKMEKYLTPYCKIIGYSLNENEFQLLIKLLDRRTFERVYKIKRKKARKKFKKVPHSSYIFSQAMANLQSSMAIHFNRKENRTGALFARRYEKNLVKDKLELDQWLEHFKNLRKIHMYVGKWRNRIRYKAGLSEKGEAKGERKGGGNGGRLWFGGAAGARDNGRLAWIKDNIETDLQGQFKKSSHGLFPRHEILKYLEIRHKIRIL